jgi:hypothetical protein
VLNDELRLPVEQVLPGMALHPLPEDWTPLEAFVLVKSLDANGHSTWSYRTTNPPNREELLGVLTVHVDLLRKELLSEWVDD